MSIDKESDEIQKKANFLTLCNNAEELRDWVFTYLDIDLPLGHIDPDSNSSPAEWLYEAYSTIRNNGGDEIPAYIILSSRDSYKTLSASVLEVLAIIHFKLTVSHMAAIKPQSAKAIQYINNFFRKIKPYMEHHGLKFTAENKSNIQIADRNGDISYVVVIVCTMTGANCIHLNTLIKDENGNMVLAKDIKPGNKILTWDYSQQKDTVVTVGNVSKTEKFARQIIFEDGSDIVLSNDHQVFTQKGWIKSDQVRLGDRFKRNNTSSFNLKTKDLLINKYDIQNRCLSKMILGTLLGDSSLQKLPSGSIRYQVSHCSDQYEYLQFIQELFQKNNIKATIIPDGIQHKLYTQCSGIFEEFYDLLYKDGIKTISKKLLPLLDFEVVSYFFMDDVRGNAKKVGSTKEHRFELAFCGFTEKSNGLISTWFNERGFVNSVKLTNKNYRLITFDLISSRKLSKKLSPYFINCLRYKLLTPQEHVNFTRNIDDGQINFKPSHSSGFTWKDNKYRNSRTGRKYLRSIKNELNLKVKEIKIIGKQKLIDLHIDTDNPHLQSFYANNCLVHNSEHTNIFVVDEVDIVQYPKAFEEAKLIPGVFNGRFPLTIKTSTRKFAYGLMQKEIDAIKVSGDILLRWNIIDVTENCPPSRHLPDKRKEVRYIPKFLPLKNISKKEFNMFQEEEKIQYDSIKAHKGCSFCPLLSVCKMRLAERSDTDYAGLYKPISATINLFKKTSPDMATAQLMCWKPSSSGLVYPRFDQAIDDGNVLSLMRAYESISGETRAQVDLPFLIEYLQTLGVKFYTGVDWGYRHYYAIVVGAKLPNGEFWIVDSYAVSELEYDDQISLAKTVRDIYKPEKWYCDPAYPMMVKGFQTNGMKCPGFTKDVMGGIESTRAQVVDAKDKRRLKVLDTDNNQFFLDMFKNHHFKSDAQGRITTHPDDEEYADTGDALRYMCQELFPLRKNTSRNKKVVVGQEKPQSHIHSKENWMKNEIKSSIKENGGDPNSVDVNKVKKRRGVMWIS